MYHVTVELCLHVFHDQIGQTCTQENEIQGKVLKIYATGWVCVKRYSYRMLIRGDRQVVVSCCCVYNLSTRARYSRGGSHDVNTGWPTKILFSILFFPLKLELFTFQICNFLKVNIFKYEIRIAWVLLKFHLPQNEPQ